MVVLFTGVESAFAYFEATRQYLDRFGKPLAFYSDKASIFRVNQKSATGGDGHTQFGRALYELNIDGICANTPAAKGRVERAHQRMKISTRSSPGASCASCLDPRVHADPALGSSRLRSDRRGIAECDSALASLRAPAGLDIEAVRILPPAQHHCASPPPPRLAPAPPAT